VTSAGAISSGDAISATASVIANRGLFDARVFVADRRPGLPVLTFPAGDSTIVVAEYIGHVSLDFSVNSIGAGVQRKLRMTNSDFNDGNITFVVSKGPWFIGADAPLAKDISVEVYYVGLNYVDIAIRNNGAGAYSGTLDFSYITM